MLEILLIIVSHNDDPRFKVNRLIYIRVEYFGPNNNTNISSAELYNLTAFALPIQENISVVAPVVTHIKRRESWQSWLTEQFLSSNNGSDVN